MRKVKKRKMKRKKKKKMMMMMMKILIIKIVKKRRKSLKLDCSKMRIFLKLVLSATCLLKYQIKS